MLQFTILTNNLISILYASILILQYVNIILKYIVLNVRIIEQEEARH